jgi:hypothetical protein
MMPATLMRSRPRGPISFVGFIAAALEKAEQGPLRGRTMPTCVACEDDGRRCGLPARYVDMKRGGFVCHTHHKSKEVLCLAK